MGATCARGRSAPACPRAASPPCAPSAAHARACRVHAQSNAIREALAMQWATPSATPSSACDPRAGAPELLVHVVPATEFGLIRVRPLDILRLLERGNLVLARRVDVVHVGLDWRLDLALLERIPVEARKVWVLLNLLEPAVRAEPLRDVDGAQIGDDLLEVVRLAMLEVHHTIAGGLVLLLVALAVEGQLVRVQDEHRHPE